MKNEFHGNLQTCTRKYISFLFINFLAVINLADVSAFSFGSPTGDIVQVHQII